MRKLALVALAAFALTVQGQLLKTPQVSPKASTEETFGITDVTVDYHRPSVAGRKIWGGLVPNDVIWRAGANENTTITFSTPVTVEGQPVAAGTYSLFMIPGAQQWTVVLNKFTGGWGAYNYDAAEDVLRVRVTPVPADMQERLSYTFDDAKNNALTLNMRWEKLRVPIKLGADTVKLTRASIEGQLRGNLHWNPAALTAAANYANRNGDPDAAMVYIDRALTLSPDANAMRVKANLLEKKGDAAGAKELRARAEALTPESSALSKGFELNAQKKYDEAIAFANDYLTKYPNSWRGYTLLGVAYMAKGDAAKAQTALDKARSLTTDSADRMSVQDAINSLAAGERVSM
jgi:hypothetical protein